ncbi:MAG TPA: OB-fold nucleic acid binding domain-containing protein, partial [Quisquiliibacterium sp.]|nr:OB-fold nucleic acid binding domain-containing protein [Quisquiliibacterium sp.]
MAADLLARLARLGIRREQDLLLHLPLRYEDETRITPIAGLLPGQAAQIEGEIARSEVVGRGRRVLQVELRDGTGDLGLRFLNFYGSQVVQLAKGRRLRASGEVRGGLLGLEMVHPRYRFVEEGEPLPTRLTPVYPSAAGIGQAGLRASVRK